MPTMFRVNKACKGSYSFPAGKTEACTCCTWTTPGKGLLKAGFGFSKNSRKVIPGFACPAQYVLDLDCLCKSLTPTVGSTGDLMECPQHALCICQGDP